MDPSKIDEEVSVILKQIDDAVADAAADFPDVGEDDLYYEMMNSVLYDRPAHLVQEVRFRLGFDWRS